MTATATRRILVVDDEQDMVQGLRRLLKLKEFDVETASNGAEAIERAREWRPDGVLMDLKMPGIDGLEACRKIRALCPDAFVILMTADPSMVEQRVAAGAVAVLIKPIDPASTCELMAKALVARPLPIADEDQDAVRRQETKPR